MPDDKTTPEIWQFKGVLRALNTYTPPTGTFDPASAWEHRYHIFFLNIRARKGKGKTGGEGMPRPDGILTVSSAPKGADIELRVESSALMDGDQTTARIRCKNDMLSTPLSWELGFTNKRDSGTKYVTFSTTGAVENGVLIKEGKPAKGAKRLETYTCDWSLFDAVQRFRRNNFVSPVTCDMIEYLDVVRENQMIESKGQTQVARAGGKIDAREYLQFGDAVLPTHYYVDANDRLFMVLGSRRLFVLLDEKAE